jgi:putative sterol carrier protein
MYINMSISGKPDVTLIITDGDLVDLMTGKLNSQKAFFQGKLKVNQSFTGLKEKTSSRLNSGYSFFHRQTQGKDLF